MRRAHERSAKAARDSHAVLEPAWLPASGARYEIRVHFDRDCAEVRGDHFHRVCRCGSRVACAAQRAFGQRGVTPGASALSPSPTLSLTERTQRKE